MSDTVSDALAASGLPTSALDASPSTPAVPAGSNTTSNGGSSPGASAPAFFQQMTKNPLFAGGIGIASLGVGAAVLRRSLLSGMLLAQKYFTVSMEIPSKDRSYQWMLHWINRHTAGKTQHLGVETQFQQLANGQVNATFEFVPSTGNHWFWYKKRSAKDGNKGDRRDYT